MFRYPLIASLFAAHLTLVVAGITKTNLSHIPFIGPGLDYYSSLSGAKAGYGFFAPEITGQAGADFEIVDANGQKRLVPLANSPNHELDVRVTDTVEQFAGIYMSSAMTPGSGQDQETQDLWRAMAASLCGTVLGRYPEAREIVFRLKTYEPVTMSDYRVGFRPAWTTVYEARFTRAPQEPGGAS